MRLRDFQVLTFDCYGTLIDWETGMIDALRPLVARLRPPPPSPYQRTSRLSSKSRCVSGTVTRASRSRFRVRTSGFSLVEGAPTKISFAALVCSRTVSM